MDRARILLYDSKKRFFKILKYGFIKEFVFDLNIDLLRFEKLLHTYPIVVFVIYDQNDMEDFLKIYKKRYFIIICTSNIEIYKKVKDIHDAVLFDLSKTKSEMIAELQEYFNMTELFFHAMTNKNIN